MPSPTAARLMEITPILAEAATAAVITYAVTVTEHALRDREPLLRRSLSSVVPGVCWLLDPTRTVNPIVPES